MGLPDRDAGTFSPEDEKKLVRRLDLRLISVSILLYFLAFLDRINISNALTLGLPEELGLSGIQPNIALAMYFPTAIACVIPCNLILRCWKPRIWLSACMLAFGIDVLCTGFVKDYAGLLVARLFLGVAEAGVFPGCTYLMASWYTRPEMLRRWTFYYSAVTIAGAFGSLLASGIENMDGVRGLSGWRWIFILEGSFTIVMAFVSYFLIVDAPAQATWLDNNERRFMIARLQKAGQQAEADDTDELLVRRLLVFFSDHKNLWGPLIFFGLSIPGYSIAYFLPTIVAGYGYDRIKTQLLSVPPFAVALAFSIAVSFTSAALNHRMAFVLLGCAVALPGAFILILVHSNVQLQYAAVFLVAAGTYGAEPPGMCWYVMNLKGSFEKAVGSAWITGLGNVAGIIAAFTFMSQDKPEYRTGYSILIAAAFFTVCTATGYAGACWIENRKRKRRGQPLGQKLLL